MKFKLCQMFCIYVLMSAIEGVAVNSEINNKNNMVACTNKGFRDMECSIKPK